MARGRATWKKYFEIKHLIAAFFRLLEDHAPAISRMMRFYSHEGPHQDMRLLEQETRCLTLDQPPYELAYQALCIDNVDGVEDPNLGRMVHIRSAITGPVAIHGHTNRAVDQHTGLILGFETTRVRWGRSCFPMPSINKPQATSKIAIPVPPFSNYYHMLIDFLLPHVLCCLGHKEQFSQGVVFCTNKEFPAVDFFVDILNSEGIPAATKSLRPMDKLHAPASLLTRIKAASTEHRYAYEEGMEMLEPHLDQLAKKIPGRPLLYLKRGATKLRNMRNASEVHDMMASEGFQLAEFGWQDFAAQVAAFRHAQFVVGTHGAGLSNIVWKKHGSLLEIFPRNARKTVYLNIAARRQWSYAHHLAGPEGSNQSFDVDVDALRQLVRQQQDQ